MRWKVGCLCVLAACAGSPAERGARGERGASGVAGPTGPVGPPGGQGPGARWVSADGVSVGAGSPPLHPDANGVLWPLDLETGDVDVDGLFTFARYGYLYTDCQGTEYAYNLPPVRMAASRAGFGAPSDFYVRPDGSVLLETELVSLKYSEAGPCSPAGIDAAVLPFDELLSVSPPAATWQGPLHLEISL